MQKVSQLFRVYERFGYWPYPIKEFLCVKFIRIPFCRRDIKGIVTELLLIKSVSVLWCHRGRAQADVKHSLLTQFVMLKLLFISPTTKQQISCWDVQNSTKIVSGLPSAFKLKLFILPQPILIYMTQYPDACKGWYFSFYCAI